MKKISVLVMAIVLLFALGACGNKDVADDLRSQKWTFVNDKGDAGKAEFGKDTAKFDIGMAMNVGFDCKFEDDKITLVNPKSTLTYDIEKDGKEYKFKSANQETKKNGGDLTLSPSK